MYKLAFEPAGFRLFKKLPPVIKEQLIHSAKSLIVSPLKGEQLKGRYRNMRSLHLSINGVAYRIIYQVQAKTETIIIRLADKRENIYKRLEHMEG